MGELILIAHASPARIHDGHDVVAQRAEAGDDTVIEVFVRIELHPPASFSAMSCAISAAFSSA